jgi:UDPglucose--hexose-1-phosphate uridylyltransferase
LATAVYTENGVLADSEKERIMPWRARVFANLYAALAVNPSPPTPEWIALAGKGSHEVIVESPDHEKSPADFTLEELELLVKVYSDRYRFYSGSGYVSIFKNWGDTAGASLSHTHTQLVAMPVIPPLIKREATAIRSAGFCPYCNIVSRELSSKRLIAQNNTMIAIAPFFSQAPYEIWILPKAEISNLAAMNANQRRDLAYLLGDALRRIKALLDDPPYNYMIFQLASGYHLNIRIQPAVSKIAGFEKGTGVHINPIPPEQAAAELFQA